MSAALHTLSDIRRGRKPTSWLVRLRVIVALSIVTIITVSACLVVLPLDLLTWGRLRRFHAEIVCRHLARIAFWLCGIRMQVDGHPANSSQVVYIANHTSSLDLFAIIAIGLPHTRYFLSGFLRAIPILAVFGHAIQVFWTCSQKFTDRRRALFQRACNELERSGDSVFLTPEGQEIGKFNRGAFHLATELSVPIVPIFIGIPTEVDPGPWSENKQFDLRPGNIHVRFMDPIDTSDWTVDQVDQHRLEVRAQYAEWTKEYRQYLPQAYE